MKGKKITELANPPIPPPSAPTASVTLCLSPMAFRMALIATVVTPAPMIAPPAKGSARPSRLTRKPTKPKIRMRNHPNGAATAPMSNAIRNSKIRVIIFPAIAMLFFSPLASVYTFLSVRCAFFNGVRPYPRSSGETHEIQGHLTYGQPHSHPPSSASSRVNVTKFGQEISGGTPWSQPGITPPSANNGGTTRITSSSRASPPVAKQRLSTP